MDATSEAIGNTKKLADFYCVQKKTLPSEICMAKILLWDLNLGWEELWEISVLLHASLWLHTDVLQKKKD